MKTERYHQFTSVCISPFTRRTVYCVHFVYTYRWFETLEEAEHYKCELFEKYFFDVDDATINDKIYIREHYLQNS